MRVNEITINKFIICPVTNKTMKFEECLNCKQYKSNNNHKIFCLTKEEYYEETKKKEANEREVKKLKWKRIKIISNRLHRIIIILKSKLIRKPIPKPIVDEYAGFTPEEMIQDIFDKYEEQLFLRDLYGTHDKNKLEKYKKMTDKLLESIIIGEKARGKITPISVMECPTCGKILMQNEERCPACKTVIINNIKGKEKWYL